MQPYSAMPARPDRDPVRLLLEAYREADLWASLEYEALHAQQLPRCLCENGARNAFRRRFKHFSLLF